MGLTEPTDHGSSDVWGSMLNAAFDLVDSHDHTAGRGVKVPSAGLKINADVSWSFGGVQYAITDMKILDFTPVTAASISSYSSALFANSSDSNNLYFRNSSGTNVQITNGATLNVSIVGGIGGDYSSVSALLDFDDASDTYRLRQQVGASVRQFAKASTADLNLFEYKSAGSTPVPTNAVTLKSPAALGASYSLTMPAAVPGSTVLVQCSSAGVLSVSNTVANALTLSAAPTAPDYKLSANQVIQIPQTMASPSANTRATAAGEGQYAITLNGGTGVNGLATFPVPLRVGDKITAWTIYLRKVTDGSNTITAQLHSYDQSSNTFVDQAAQTTSANNPGAVTLGQTGLSLTLAANVYYFVSVGMTAGAGTTDTAYYLEVSYQRP